ncbi:amidohydrolase [Pseudotenacibaculum sp. MALMAid0570]|mgnify:CR=1 FL=1|uniref:amidohydrolase n=1 Tax=Pseudotenacibaculum sp. MALMAid0570 TaxID=3143938 RepID=UPI0032DE55C0
MQEALTVVAIQANLIWEKTQENLDLFESKINELSEDVDLIILPEMFSTGFTMEPKSVAEKMNGITVQWMKKIAITKKIALVGSVVIEEDNKYYNRAIFIHPNGLIETYDKRHSFSLAGEHKAYTSGKEKLIVDYKGWKLLPLICYDLRFPVWSRSNNDYDILLYMANWPKPRIVAWDSLLKARAIENMSYCIGVNRVGEDKNGHQYIGHTAVYDYLGEQIGFTKEAEEGYLKTTLFKKSLQETRKKLNFLNDRDQFLIKD